MAKIQCKICGGMLTLPEDKTSGECPYCGMLTTFPRIVDEQTAQLYIRAEHFRQSCNFDKAVATYEAILNLNTEDPEAYWGLLISRYGIEYVEDPSTHERIPTCHRVQFDSILTDPDYRNALKFASDADRGIYEKEAHRIADIQKSILKISSQEEPYDVFICYKEASENGERTKDSLLAQDMYNQLTNQGLKVFFARISLEDKIGLLYEPYIFAALNSAKVMLVVGSKKEHFEAVWVKNEWSRFLALKKKDPSRLLVPCFFDMDTYDIPEELLMFQCQDMSKIGFMQDLLRGIMKLVTPGENKGKSNSPNPDDNIPEIEKIKRRVSILIEQDDWEKAVSYCEKRLDSNPENADLYFLICLLEHRIPDESATSNVCCDILNDTNYQIALKYASPERKQQLNSIARNMAVDFYLKQCMDARRIQDPKLLSQSSIPLASDDSFQAALQIAERERMDQLLDIQRDQCNYFLGKCMEANHVSDEAGLIRCERPLSEDTDFKTAIICAAPDDRERLLRIQYAQSDAFLRKCMEKHRIYNASELARSKSLLQKDPSFLAALSCAAPEQVEELKKTAKENTALVRKKRWKRIAFMAVLSAVLIIVTYWFRLDLQIGIRLGIPEAQYQYARILHKRYIPEINENLPEVKMWFRKAAENGHIKAQHDLAFFAETPQEKEKWLLKAAEQGLVEAQYQLGCLYSNKDEIKNIPKAIEWFRKAADQGNVEAQYELGRIYLYEDEVEDLAESERWLKKAEENGHPNAKSSLEWLDFHKRMQQSIRAIKRERQREEEMQRIQELLNNR